MTQRRTHRRVNGPHASGRAQWLVSGATALLRGDAPSQRFRLPAGPWGAGLRHLLSVCLAVMCLAPLAAHAEDVVVLRVGGSSGKTVLRGDVIDYTGRKLTIRLKPNAPPKSYPVGEVVEVRMAQTATHRRAETLFALGRVSQSEEAFRQALDQEPREWVRREILARLIQCALHRSDYVTAATRFQALVASDPTTRHYGLIPLQWDLDPPPAAVASAARGWLANGDAVSRLLGASWLAFDTQYRGEAATALRALSSVTDDRIRELARAQLWRLQVRSGSLSRTELNRWEGRIESLPSTLRGGPYFVLGLAHARLGQHERAATCFLWTALVFDDDRRLAAMATLGAAQSLEQTGREDEARILFREVVVRFADTEFAATARNALPSDDPALRNP